MRSSKMTEKTVTIEELDKVKAELRGFVDYHILTASKYLTDIHHIEDAIKTLNEAKQKEAQNEQRRIQLEKTLGHLCPEE